MTYANGIVESGQWDKWLIHGTRTWPGRVALVNGNTSP